MLSWYVHYKNKYPGCKIFQSEQSFDVYDKDGDHCVALRKSGGGQWVDESAKLGCVEEHCLAPIPKDARVHKDVGGCVALDDKAAEREKLKDQFLSPEGHKVLSVAELMKQGFEFDEKQRVIKKPSQA